MCRTVSAEALRMLFLGELRDIAKFWGDKGDTDGMAFSVLSLLDGCRLGFPGVDLVARPHPDDKAYCQSIGEDWIEDGVVLNEGVMLHEMWHKFTLLEGRKRMDIEQLTIGQARELAGLFPAPTQKQSHSFEIGKAYLIRTVTMHYTGRVVAVTDSDVLLEDAAWIADTGRFADCLKTGSLNEIEPYPGRVAVCRGGMIDFTEWTHDLPRKQK